MWHLTASEADFWFAVSNVVLIIGASAVLIGTWGAYEMSKVREHFGDVRTSENEKAAAQARAEAAQANEGLKAAEVKIAEAEARTAEANLKAERLKQQLGWRDVTPDQARQIRAVIGGRRIELAMGWVAGDAESSHFASQLAGALHAAGVHIVAGSPFGMMGNEIHGIYVQGYRRDEVELICSALRAAGYAGVHQEIVPPPATPQSPGQYINIMVGYRGAPQL